MRKWIETWEVMSIITDKTKTRLFITEEQNENYRVGVMKDSKLKLRGPHDSYTLGSSGDWKVRPRGSKLFIMNGLIES